MHTSQTISDETPAPAGRRDYMLDASHYIFAGFVMLLVSLASLAGAPLDTRGLFIVTVILGVAAVTAHLRDRNKAATRREG